MDLTIYWELFKEAMTVATGIVATSFSFYFTWQKIGKSVKVFYSINFEILSDIRINNIVISNYKNKPIEIYNIYATINNEYYLEVENFDSPIILKPLETTKITTSPLSCWKYNNENENIDIKKLLLNGKIELYISTNTSIIKCKTLKHENPLCSKKFQSLKFISKYTAKYNDIVYTQDVIYVIVFMEGNKQKTVFVFNDGMMSSAILGFNALPKELLKSKEVIKNYFKSQGLNILIQEKDSSGLHF